MDRFDYFLIIYKKNIDRKKGKNELSLSYRMKVYAYLNYHLSIYEPKEKKRQSYSPSDVIST